MDEHSSDIARAREARAAHGAKAGQHLVDLIQAALRRGDEVRAAEAARALRILG